MELSEIGEWISAGSDVIVGLSAAVAAWFASRGLSAWRKELKGRSEYQLAKDVLKSVYDVRDAFMHVRNPAIFQFEYPEEMRDHHGHLRREHDYEGTKHVYDERWKVLVKAFSELEKLHLDAQVEWGPEFADKIRKLRLCRVELQIAIEQLLDGKKDPREAEQMAAADRTKQRSVLYHLGSNSKHDQFTPQIEEAIQEFESWLRPYVNAK